MQKVRELQGEAPERKKERKAMSNKSPYKRGNYAKLFSFWQSEKKGIATRQEIVSYGQSIGMKETEAEASATVILSPRESDGRGDCRGNLSAQGHVYFAEPLAKAKGENRRFRLRWRNPPLAKRTRSGDSAETAEVTGAVSQTATTVAEPVAESVAPAAEPVAAPEPAAPVDGTDQPAQ